MLNNFAKFLSIQFQSVNILQNLLWLFSFRSSLQIQTGMIESITLYQKLSQPAFFASIQKPGTDVPHLGWHLRAAISVSDFFFANIYRNEEIALVYREPHEAFVLVCIEENHF